MVIDNLNLLAAALNTTPSAFFVTALSLANALGRVLAGALSDAYVHRVSRLQLLALVALGSSMLHATFALGSEELLYPCVLLAGLLFGASVSMVALNVVEVFGEKYVPTNFGAVDSAPIIGSYIFVTWVVSAFFQANTVDDQGGSSCVGADCFRTAFLVNSACCAGISVMVWTMHMVTPIQASIVPR
jgi:MFS family permease